MRPPAWLESNATKIIRAIAKQNSDLIQIGFLLIKLA